MCKINHCAMAETQKIRRSNKPLMERRRRERINQCLNELKSLVLVAQRKDPSRYTKLEKADILEMTVRHVQNLHRQEANSSSPAVGEAAASRYRAGYAQCAAEVGRFLANTNGLPIDLTTRITSHLRASSLTQMIAPTPPASGHPPTSEPVGVMAGTPSSPNIKMESCSSPVVTGATFTPPQMIPSRFTTTQLALFISPWPSVAPSTSPPTSADAAGTPCSPESACVSPQSPSNNDVTPPMVDDVTKTSPIKMEIPSLVSPSTPKKEAPQIVPLDLAVPHRRLPPIIHHPYRKAARKGSPTPAAVAKSYHQRLRVINNAPYPAHMQEPSSHWRPW